MIGGLPLGSALKRQGLESCTCFFCTIPFEDIHRLIKCHIAHIIWKYLLDIWKVLTRCYLRPHWVFSQYVQNGPNDELKIFFQFLRYWGLQHNLNICNAFMLMVQIEWKTIWRHSYVEFLDVSACRDHFLKCIFRFANGFTWCLFPYICK